MKKTTLDPVIQKYYLSALNESAKWKVDAENKKLTIYASTNNNVLTAKVQLSNFEELPTGDFGINDTSKLIKMLGVLDEEVKLATNDDNGRITSITVNDKSTEVQYVTADLKTLSIRAYGKDNPDFEVEIIADEYFRETYIAAHSALKDAEYVTFAMNKLGKLEMIFGQVTGSNNKLLNTSKIKYTPATKEGKSVLSKPLSFHAAYLKEILKSNKESTDSTLYLSPIPLAHMSFTSGDIISNYHIAGIVGK